MSEIVTVSDGEAAVDISRPLTRAEAEELTAHIRNAADVMWVLIARAHAGRVWEALDYPSWEAYVRDEFDMSRSRAYQLLDQAKVVAAIQAAAPVGTEVKISEKSARDLRKVLAPVVEEVAEKTEGMDPDDAGETIDGILNEWRAKADDFDGGTPSTSDEDPYGIMSNPAPSQPRRDPIDDFDLDEFLSEELDGDDAEPEEPSNPARPTPAASGIDPAVLRRTVQACYDLYSSLSSLKSMPEIDGIIKAIPVERYDQVTENLPLAMEWLTEFSQRWEAHRNAPPSDGDETSG